MTKLLKVFKPARRPASSVVDARLSKLSVEMLAPTKRSYFN